MIERALYAEDPKFASTVRATDLRSHLRRRTKRLAFVVALGFALLVGGILVPSNGNPPFIAIAGFVIMVAAGFLMARSWLKLTGRVSDAPKLRLDRARDRHEGGWKSRIEDRWRRRFDDRDY
jgi:hypothetical protein